MNPSISEKSTEALSYESPAIVFEALIEARAGSPLSLPLIDLEQLGK